MQVGDATLKIEILVGGNVLACLRVCDNSRDHACGGGNITHDDTVARASFDLETVGESLALTEVDEVVGGAMEMLAGGMHE